jgi:hypothetical protein
MGVSVNDITSICGDDRNNGSWSNPSQVIDASMWRMPFVVQVRLRGFA